MESRKIPDTAIKAYSHRVQHPAHHGRLGGDSYWCSEEEKAHFIEIYLPKKYNNINIIIYIIYCSKNSTQKRIQYQKYNLERQNFKRMGKLPL